MSSAVGWSTGHRDHSKLGTPGPHTAGWESIYDSHERQDFSWVNDGRHGEKCVFFSMEDGKSSKDSMKDGWTTRLLSAQRNGVSALEGLSFLSMR